MSEVGVRFAPLDTVRVETLQEVVDASTYFFQDVEEYDEKVFQTF